MIVYADEEVSRGGDGLDTIGPSNGEKVRLSPISAAVRPVSLFSFNDQSAGRPWHGRGRGAVRHQVWRPSFVACGPARGGVEVAPTRRAGPRVLGRPVTRAIGTSYYRTEKRRVIHP